MNTKTRFQMADSDVVQWNAGVGALSIYGASSVTVYLTWDQKITAMKALSDLVIHDSPARIEGSIPGRAGGGTHAFMYPLPDCHIFATLNAHPISGGAPEVTLFLSHIGDPNGGLTISMSEPAAERVLAAVMWTRTCYVPPPSAPRRWLDRVRDAYLS